MSNKRECFHENQFSPRAAKTRQSGGCKCQLSNWQIVFVS